MCKQEQADPLEEARDHIRHLFYDPAIHAYFMADPEVDLHPKQEVEVGFRRGRIDVDLCELIRGLWSRGIDTIASCQDHIVWRCNRVVGRADNRRDTATAPRLIWRAQSRIAKPDHLVLDCLTNRAGSGFLAG
jgi:hypothetical protein